MNQLNKLIEQYETENPGKKAVYTDDPPRGGLPIDYYEEDFALWLASRPTCGVEQRKFLDEVENSGIIDQYANVKDDGCDQFNIIIGGETTIHDLDFYPAIKDIKKVIKGE